MELCPQCRKAMEEGYVLRANTYGTIRVERGIAKKDGVRAAFMGGRSISDEEAKQIQALIDEHRKG